MARYQAYFRGSQWDARPQLRHRDCRRSAEKNATFGAALHDGQRASLSDLHPVKQLAVQVFSRDSGTIVRPEKSRKNATPECQILANRISRSGGRSDRYTQTDCNVGGGVNQPRAANRRGFDPHPTQKERTCEDDRQNTPHLRHNSEDK